MPTTYLVVNISLSVIPLIRSKTISRIIQMINATVIKITLSFVNIFIIVRYYLVIPITTSTAIAAHIAYVEYFRILFVVLLN